MFTSQRKMMMRTRNSQWRQQQKPYQSQGEFHQRSFKYHSKVAIKTKKMMEMEKIMFYDELAPLRFKVASNHLILKNIMSYMTFSTLQTARLVSKDWKKVANLELKRRKCCKKCIWRADHNDFEIIRNSNDLSWIELDCKYLEEKYLDKFASVCGHQVQILKIGPCETFWKLVGAGEFPKLEILKFKQWRITAEESLSNNLLLNRISNFDPAADSVGDIVWPFPNLQRIEGIRLSEASLIPSEIFQYKFHLIKAVTIDSWSIIPNSLNHVTMFAQAKPKLERIKIGQYLRSKDVEFIKQLYLILESSRQSLQYLKIVFINSFYLEFSLPFRRLSTLHIYIGSRRDIEISQVIKLLENCRQESLPNLKTMKFEIYTFGIVFLDPFDVSPGKNREGGVLRSVVNLEFGCKYFSSEDLVSSNWFPRLSILLPNVQKVTIGNLKTMDEALLDIFVHWPKLVSLEIIFFHHSPQFDLDPVLTGLSPEKCEELRKVEPEKMMTEEILNGRTWPNLHSLKGLKRLDIILRGMFKSSYWYPLSFVSFLYAINLHQELKTTIHFPESRYVTGFRKFLQPLAPYAKLEGYCKTAHCWKM